MDNKYVNVKKFSNLTDVVKIHHKSFGHARYILHRALEIKTLENIQFPKPMLEIGIGNGFISSLFFQSKIDFGVEIKEFNPTWYDIYGEVRHIDEKKNLLPFDDESLRSIYSMSVLEHVKNLSNLLKESNRILLKGGLFVANVNTDKCKQEPLNFTLDGCPHLYSPNDWKKLIESYGFIVTHTIPALPQWIPMSLDITASISLLKIPILKRLILKDYWNSMFKNGFFSSDINKDFTVTLICEKV